MSFKTPGKFLTLVIASGVKLLDSDRKNDAGLLQQDCILFLSEVLLKLEGNVLKIGELTPGIGMCLHQLPASPQPQKRLSCLLRLICP